MTWAKIDDQFHNHPKLAALGPLMLPCVGLHVLALSWCAQYLTDGLIPFVQVRKLAGDLPRAHRGNPLITIVTKLVDVGLWEALAGPQSAPPARVERSNSAALRTLKIHDYLQYNPSRATVLEERKRTAERVARFRAARAASQLGNAVSTASPVPSPYPVVPSVLQKKNPSVVSPSRGDVREPTANVNGLEPDESAAEGGGEAAAKQLVEVPAEWRDAMTLLEFLNAKTGRTYGATRFNLALIDARLREGWSVQDCRTMVMRKWRDWRDDARMATYARPATLFNRNKLESYMAELGFTARS